MKATQDMTDKQILAECRPKLVYYPNSYSRLTARPCLLCGSVVEGRFEDLERHALERHTHITQKGG